MKKIFVLFAFILGFGFVSNAQTQPAGDQAKPSGFKFETETHDFGKIPVGKPVTFVFKYTNVGDVPLIISNAVAQCGCTTPVLSPAEGVPVKKGGEGNVKVTFNAASVGQFTKTVTITSNTAVKVLKIVGEVVKSDAPSK